MGKKREAKKADKQARKGKKGRFYIGGLAILLVVGVLTWSRVYTKTPGRSSSAGSAAPGAYVKRETKTPLSPLRFVGKTERAYQVAQEIPDVLDHLYCYCQCDKHVGHLTLLSCYTDNHAAT